MIDLRRTEQRFFISQSESELLLTELLKLLDEVSFSDRPYSQTVYIGDDEFLVPWGISLKARRYLPCQLEKVTFEPTTTFNCEIKAEESAGSQGRIKEKRSLTISDFINWIKISLKITEAIRPHVLTQYHRRHFTRPSMNLRLTFDTEIRYGYFLPEGQFIWTGDENGSRIEIKVDEQAFGSQVYGQILAILEHHGAMPVISKKEQAYNFQGAYLDGFSCKPQKEITGVEIEAKFEVNQSHYQKLLADLKNGFLAGVFPGLYIADDYPYTQATTSINHYWSKAISGQPSDGVKLLFRVGNFSVVTKADTIVIPDPHQLGCILKRTEKKSQVYPHTNQALREIIEYYTNLFGPLEYCGFVYRQRRAFWPETIKEGRIYHLSIDRCITPRGLLYQLELEYVGRRPGDWQVSSSTEEKIIAELGELAWAIYNWVNRGGDVLMPSRLTKFEWLVGGQGA